MGKTTVSAMTLILPAAITFIAFSAPSALAGFEWTPPMQMEAPELDIPQPQLFPALPAQPVQPVYELPLSPSVPQPDSPTPLMATSPDAPQPRINPYAPSAMQPFDPSGQTPTQQSFIPPQTHTSPALSTDAATAGQVTYQGQPLRRKRPHVAMPSMQLAPAPVQPAMVYQPAPVPVANGVPVIDLYPLRRGEQARHPDAAIFAPPQPPIAQAAPLPAPQTVQKPYAAPQERSGIAVPVPAHPAPSYAQAVGFGTNIPLALAISQIVPPDYPYSFSENVNPGVRINWSGGKPWNVVLQEAIAPHGLTLVISGNGVMIVPASNGFGATQAPTDYGYGTTAIQEPFAPPESQTWPPSAPSYPAPYPTGPREPMVPIPLNSGNWGG